MYEPLISLTIGITILILLVLFFRPNSKLLSWIRKIRQNKQRVHMEDALKHLYECETTNRSCTIKSIAGALSQNSDKATAIMQKLNSSKLIQIKDDTFQLTDAGRSYALKVIRLHRLWELYLAEETGVPESIWHEEAEIHEHNLTFEEAERINRKLGNPLFDPHGAPIPKENGELPKFQRTPLTQVQIGKNAVITHIEDEPWAIYESLVNKGLRLGMQIQVKDRQDNNLFLNTEGQVKSMTHLEALNVSVSPITQDQKIDYSPLTLDALKTNQKAEILAISKACHGQQRRRLMDLGVLPGTEISVEMESLGGDPIAYFIRGTTIALRRNQAKMIHVRPI